MAALDRDKPLFELNAYGYRERAQHCRDFAMTLQHDDPLRASVLQTAHRFEMLALADQLRTRQEHGWMFTYDVTDSWWDVDFNGRPSPPRRARRSMTECR